MKLADYKGRPYRLEFKGRTKFGDKAKLAFLDGSKEFWVDAALIANEREGSASSSNGSSRSQGRACAECGKSGALVADLEDGLFKHYRCCDIPPG